MNARAFCKPIANARQTRRANPKDRIPFVQNAHTQHTTHDAKRDPEKRPPLRLCAAVLRPFNAMASRANNEPPSIVHIRYSEFGDDEWKRSEAEVSSLGS